MSHSADEYRAQMQTLLPRGPAWPREDGAVLTRLIDALAQEFARLDLRAEQLLDETDPSTAYELLEDWERALGLPDPCTSTALTVAARQAAVWRKFAFQVGQTPAFYVALAASIGFEIDIHEFDPDVDDHDPSLTSAIAGGRWRYVWRVHVLNAADYSVFRFGDAFGGRFVEAGSALDLECILTAAKPAHTHVIFTYPES